MGHAKHISKKRLSSTIHEELLQHNETKKNTKVGKIFEVMLYKTRLKNGQCIDKKYSTSGKCKLGPKWDSYTFIF